MTQKYDVLDVDTALRTLDLVGGGSSSLDIVMSVKSKRAGYVKVESERVFDDETPRMDVIGYFLAAVSPTDQSSGKVSGRRQYSALRVIRMSDASTGSMLSIFGTNEDAIEVEVAAYKAGGDSQSKDAKPTLRIIVKGTRIKSYTLLAGCVAGGGPVEIIDFAFRTINIASAQQSKTGSRGALVTFDDSLDTEI